MTAEREGLAEEIAEVLTEHGFMPCSQTTPTVSAWWAQCYGCDWKGPRRSHSSQREADHRAHLADLLAARDRRVRGEALREAADALYAGEGLDIEAYADERYGDWLNSRADRIEAAE